MGTVSSLAHLTSQSCPVALAVFLLTRATMPSQPLTLVRQFVFHALSQGCLTDISTNSNGLLLLLFAHTLEWFTVRFLVHEPSGVGIPLRPTLVCRIEDLGPISHSSIAVSITCWGIRSHKATPPFIKDIYLAMLHNLCHCDKIL